METDFDFEIASNLEELSVFGHRGGGRLWHAFIRQEHLPKLRRLGFAEVTNYEGGSWEEIDEEVEDGSENPEMDSINEFPAFFDLDAPLAQLDVLVTDWQDGFAKIPNFPFDRFLVMIDSWQPLSKDLLRNCTAYMFPQWRLRYRHEVDQWFQGTLRLLTEEGRPTRFISLPPYEVCGGRGNTERILELKTIVEDIRKKGIEVAIEEDHEKWGSLILPSFVDYLKRAGKLSR
jgi:hypothetical protein